MHHHRAIMDPQREQRSPFQLYLHRATGMSIINRNGSISTSTAMKALHA